jgi:cytoskeletal protein RodZ
MKFSAILISICLTLFLWFGGCSREEPPPPPDKKDKVVMPIKRPVPQKADTSVPDKQEKAQEEPEETAEVKTAAVEEKALKPPETEIMRH